MHLAPLPVTATAAPRWRSLTAAMTVHAVAAAAILVMPLTRSPIDQGPAIVVELVTLAAPPPPSPEPAPQPQARPQPASLPPQSAPVAAKPRPVAKATPTPQSAPVETADVAAAAAPAPAASPAPSAAPATPTVAEPALVPPSARAAYLANPRPAYPSLARKRGWEGTVLLAVAVDAEGKPVEVEIKESSGHALLDRCAEEAVRRWRFVPARRGDRQVAASVEVPVRFSLTEGEDGLG